MTMFIQFFVMFLAALPEFAHSLAHLTLCQNGSSIYNTNSISQKPKAIVLREMKSHKEPMEDAFDDVVCWLEKNFIIEETFSIDSKNDNETLCYKVATIPIKPGSIMIVLTEGNSIDSCVFNIYGPIPNILNVKMFIDVKSSTAKIYTRRLELSFRNAGGRIGVQFELFRALAYRRIAKTLEFMMYLNTMNLKYANLIPWWQPMEDYDVPPSSYQERATYEEHQELRKDNFSISPLMVVSCLPMIVFGIVVSCYLVIHPRGGLTYTDEEIDFVIHEVESASSLMTTAKERTPSHNNVSMTVILTAIDATQKTMKTDKKKQEEPMEMHTPMVYGDIPKKAEPAKPASSVTTKSIRKSLEEQKNIEGNGHSDDSLRLNPDLHGKLVEMPVEVKTEVQDNKNNIVKSTNTASISEF